MESTTPHFACLICTLQKTRTRDHEIYWGAALFTRCWRNLTPRWFLVQIIFSFFCFCFCFLFLLFCQVLRKIHLNLCKNVGTIGSADWVDGRQFSAVRYVEKVLCFCLTLCWLHFIIWLACIVQPDLLLLLLLLLLSVSSSDRRNCLAIVFSCGKSRFYLKIMGKSHCAFVGFALL